MEHYILLPFGKCVVRVLPFIYFTHAHYTHSAHTHGVDSFLLLLSSFFRNAHKKQPILVVCSLKEISCWYSTKDFKDIQKQQNIR